MPFPWLAGQRITAERMNENRMILVEQTADQTITGSTTYIDSEISFTPDVGATYFYWLLISYSAVEAADFKWRWSASEALFASFTQARHIDATGTFNAGAEVIFRRPGNTTDRIAGGGGTTSPPDSFFSAYDQGTFTTSGVSAPVTMQFAQRVSDAGDTILRGSNQTRLLLQRIA